jgi:hypothetical protein
MMFMQEHLFSMLILEIYKSIIYYIELYLLLLYYVLTIVLCILLRMAINCHNHSICLPTCSYPNVPYMCFYVLTKCICCIYVYICSSALHQMTSVRPSIQSDDHISTVELFSVCLQQFSKSRTSY